MNGISQYSWKPFGLNPEVRLISLTDETSSVLCPLSEPQLKHCPTYETSMLCMATTGSNAFGWNEFFLKRKEIWLLNKYETAQIVSEQTSQGHTNTHRRTRRRTDGRRNKLTDEETEGRKEGGMEGGGQITEGEDIGVKKWKERNRVREREREKWRGGNGKEEPCVVHLQSV